MGDAELSKEPSLPALVFAGFVIALIFAAAYEHLDSGLTALLSSFAFLILGYRMGLPVPPPGPSEPQVPP